MSNYSHAPDRRSLLSVNSAVAMLTALALIALAVVTSFARPSSATTSSGGGYQFVDNFNGPAGSAVNSSIWSYQTGGGWNGGTQSQYYTSGTNNAALTGNGDLMITAKGQDTTASNGTVYHYTSARLISKQSVLYGTMSARIRLTGSQGAFPAFWSMGANYPQVGWPACGEIDTMEAVNNYPNLYGSFHGAYTPAKGYNAYNAYNAGKMTSPSGGLGTGWHVYSTTWTPTSVTFSLDGTPYVTVHKADLPSNEAWDLDNPQNLILNLAVGGMAGTPAVPADFNASMEVNWVKVTSNTKTSASSTPTGSATASATSAAPSAGASTSSPALPSSNTSALSTSTPTSTSTASAPTASGAQTGPVSIRQINGTWYLQSWVSVTATTRIAGSATISGQAFSFAENVPSGKTSYNLKLPATPGGTSVPFSLTITPQSGSAQTTTQNVAWPAS